MNRPIAAVLLALAMVVVVSLTAVPSVAASATGQAESVEMPDGTEATSPTETTTAPDDGPDGHADDPFPSWLPLLYAAGLLVGIAAVGGGLWLVVARVRRFLNDGP